MVLQGVGETTQDRSKDLRRRLRGLDRSVPACLVHALQEALATNEKPPQHSGVDVITPSDESVALVLKAEQRTIEL